MGEGRNLALKLGLGQTRSRNAGYSFATFAADFPVLGKELFAMAEIQACESGARVMEPHNLRLGWSARNELGNGASCDIVAYSRERAGAAALLVQSTNDEFDVAFTVFVA